MSKVITSVCVAEPLPKTTGSSIWPRASSGALLDPCKDLWAGESRLYGMRSWSKPCLKGRSAELPPSTSFLRTSTSAMQADMTKVLEWGT